LRVIDGSFAKGVLSCIEYRGMGILIRNLTLTFPYMGGNGKVYKNVGVGVFYLTLGAFLSIIECLLENNLKRREGYEERHKGKCADGPR
jgi:hypothetical protein